MKLLKICLAIGCLACGVAVAAPNFVTPNMMKRNGLTDEQYELLWSQGKRPTVDIAAARDWIFRASRYTNVVEWLEVMGQSNDFARLSHKLQAENFGLLESNKVVVAINKALEREYNTISTKYIAAVDRAQQYADAYASATNAFAAATNSLAQLRVDYANATNRAEIAEARAARLGSLRDYLVELRDKAPLLTTKSIYQALIDRIDERTSQP